MRSSLFILLIFLAACTPLFPPQPKADRQIFFLSDIKDFNGNVSNKEINLVIDEVETNAGLDTNKVAVTDKNQLRYIENTFWADSLSDAVRSTLIESLENSNKFQSVTTELHGIRGNYALSINIRDFQVEDGNNAKVKIVGKLISLPKRRVLLGFTSQSSKQAESSNVADVVNALNESFQEVQKEIVAKISAFMVEQNND